MKHTHEAFVHGVAQAAIARLPVDAQAPLRAIKLVYGAGRGGLRGVTYYNTWKGANSDPAPFVEVCAFGQESHVQVAGTTIHELAHVLAGWSAGHGPEWKKAARLLGLRNAKRAGHRYLMAGFDPDIRAVVAGLPKPDDGEPVAPIRGQSGTLATLKPCGAGRGTHGGKSFGQGSGRNRLFECACIPPVKVRVGRPVFDATCNCCGTAFALK